MQKFNVFSALEVKMNYTKIKISTTTMKNTEYNQQKLSYLKSITLKEIEEIFNSPGPKHSADQKPKIVKYCKDELHFTTSSYHKHLHRTANSPRSNENHNSLFKIQKRGPYLMENNPPISILPTFSKYLEQAINKQLINSL